MIRAILAIGPNGLLGDKNGLVWSIPSELKFFKEMTLNSMLIMGGKTFDTLPGKLPDRAITTFARTPREDTRNFTNINELTDFIDFNAHLNIFIAGGKLVYERLLHMADEIYVSEISGDEVFSKLDEPVYLKFDFSGYEKEIYKNTKNYRVYKYTRKDITW